MKKPLFAVHMKMKMLLYLVAALFAVAVCFKPAEGMDDSI